MLHQQLREHTRLAHSSLEQVLIGYIKSINTKEQYGQLLILIYGYYHSVELALSKYLGQEKELDFSQRRKAQQIIDDLFLVGVNTRPEEVCKDVPQIHSYAAALGVMYVLEGSTLGGKIIADIISRKLNLNTTAGLSFFLSYGDEVQVMWEKFKILLKQAFTEEEKQEIVKAALNTFETFKRWLDKHESS